MEMLFLWALFVLIGVFVAPAILRIVWNMTMPDLFGLPEIEHWQAFRLILIGGLLFGGPAVGVGG